MKNFIDDPEALRKAEQIIESFLKARKIREPLERERLIRELQKVLDLKGPYNNAKQVIRVAGKVITASKRLAHLQEKKVVPETIILYRRGNEQRPGIVKRLTEDGFVYVSFLDGKKPKARLVHCWAVEPVPGITLDRFRILFIE